MNIRKKRYSKEKLNKIKNFIRENAIIWGNKEKIVSREGQVLDFVIDLRRAFLKAEFLELIAEFFWDIFEEEFPFCVGGQETGAIPLISAILLEGRKRGKNPQGFYVRKQRKKYDLCRFIEGELLGCKKIFLVDDLVNSGSTIERQIKLLTKEGFDFNKIQVFVLISFWKETKSDIVNILKKRKKFFHLFSLKEDFGIEPKKEEFVNKSNFKLKWFFKGALSPSYYLSVSKSSPVVDEKRVYFGTDERVFWALNKESGKVEWKFETGHPVFGKSISSSPLIFKEKIFFGSYDGNFYALNKENGNLIWKFSEADAIHSSPCISEKDNIIFVGLERNWQGKKGAIVALDADTGEKRWEYLMREYVPASPCYFSSKEVVAIGSNDRNVYLFDAREGRLKWNFLTSGEVKGSISFCSSRNWLSFGSFDGNVYILDVDLGKEVIKFPTQDKIYSTPIFHDDLLIFTSTDKRCYCYDLNGFKLLWERQLPGRIFSSPLALEDKVFLGCNDGFIYEIDLHSGVIVSRFDLIERVTNNVVYDKDTKNFFVLNYANELYCLEYLRDSRLLLDFLIKIWRQ